ncbi:hypothetical protein [Streptomyces sp. BBFR102]
MNICARCDKPILYSEEYDRIAVEAVSGARPDVLLHRECPGSRPRDRA